MEQLRLPCLFHCTMTELSTHIRHVLLYKYESGHSTAEAHRKLCRVFGSEAPSVRFVYSWFERFRRGNRSLEDEPRSSRPKTISLDELRKLAEHPYEGVRCFAEHNCPFLFLLVYENFPTRNFSMSHRLIFSCPQELRQLARFLPIRSIRLHSSICLFFQYFSEGHFSLNGERNYLLQVCSFVCFKEVLLLP
ncbi:unnamed protein product [Heligmosomoides polygyrus]|uniref:HTH_48 domain-containing protein n=1 Tax=Heligmosomoides polygyrus TaxID=6339 RepID=A0A183FE26_HELPZ|nr:unnamed protein product [Heligmosomoides polygyrus]